MSINSIIKDIDILIEETSKEINSLNELIRKLKALGGSEHLIVKEIHDRDILTARLNALSECRDLVDEENSHFRALPRRVRLRRYPE